MGKLSELCAGINWVHELNTTLASHSKALKEILGDEGEFVYISEGVYNKGTFEVRSATRNIATFGLQQLPGCCGVVVSYHAEVLHSLRKKGIGEILLKVRMDAAREMGYGLITATVLSTNTQEIVLLLRNGWVQRGEFRNPRTQHLVTSLSANL